jgi:plastocyanin
VRRYALALCASLAALSGCGDDDDPGRTVTVGAETELQVKADEYSFDPERIVVEGAPSSLRFDLDNVGSLAHNLHVLDGDRSLGGVRSFPAGEQRRFTVRVPPGSYRLVCTVGDHEELGMVGRLEVKGQSSP